MMHFVPILQIKKKPNPNGQANIFQRMSFEIGFSMKFSALDSMAELNRQALDSMVQRVRGGAGYG